MAVLDGKTTGRLFSEGVAIVVSILLAVALDDLIAKIEAYLREHGDENAAS